MSQDPATLNPSTPEGRWAMGKIKASELLDDALKATGTSSAAYAQRVGLKHKSRVQHMRDPERSAATVPLHLLWAEGAPGVSDALWERVRQLRGERDPDLHGDNDMARLAAVKRATDAFEQAYLEAAADLSIDDQEAELLLRMAYDVQRRIAGAIANLQERGKK